MPVATLCWMRHAGTCPKSYKISHRVASKRSDVEAWLEAQHAIAMAGMPVSSESTVRKR